MIATFQIHFLDQGRVDAFLIVSNGETVFFDSGYRKNGLKCIDYMKSLGIDKLKYYVASHGHKNHIEGASPIIHQLKPDVIFMSHKKVKDAIVKYAAKGEEKDFVSSANYAIMEVGNYFELGDTKFTCIGPLKIKSCLIGSSSENHNSLILRADRGNRHLALFTGDTSGSILAKIEQNEEKSIDAEMLKNPHHNGAQSLYLLKKINPKVIAICNNKQISQTYMKRISEVGADFYTTCKKCSGNFMLEERDGNWKFRKL